LRGEFRQNVVGDMRRHRKVLQPPHGLDKTAEIGTCGYVSEDRETAPTLVGNDGLLAFYGGFAHDLHVIAPENMFYSR
jgi:hypothetical protein